MTSREIVKRVIRYGSPPRMALHFNDPAHSDIICVGANEFDNPENARYRQFGSYPEILAKVPGFHGEVRVDPFGNIYGRFHGRTNGECILGALQGGWDALEGFSFPPFDPAYDAMLKSRCFRESGRFVLGSSKVAVFSTLRDLRHMDNALMDTVLEKESVRALLEKVEGVLLRTAESAYQNGMDGIILYDDWGMQHALFISPASFRELFKPVYAKIAGYLHERGMYLFVHSCGLVYDIIEDFIGAGVDVLQFDQPELSGSGTLAREFGGRVAFYCPVDIQKIMATGDKRLIQEGALHMIGSFKKYCGGAGLIIKDYPQWEDINVKPEWVEYAHEVILNNIAL